MEVYLISACLMGLKTKYDGKIIVSDIGMKAVAGAVCIPVCPEQLGGLSTPRVAADLTAGNGHDVLAGRSRVITRTGLDVTVNFILGARQVLEIAKHQQITKVFLKARSPSCGLNPRVGVTAALLQAEGFTVVEME